MENRIPDLLQKAYFYTLPLMIMDATHVKMTNTVKATDLQAPKNQFIHALTLADAKFTDVVTPNVDTIYSQVYLDLAQDAVVLTMPRTDRFCNAEILDAYTNCITVLDAGTFEQESQTFLFTGPNFSGPIPEGMIQVASPTALNWVLIRTICFSKEDEAQVHAIQGNMSACTLAQYQAGTQNQPPEGTFDPANNFIPVRQVLGMSMADYFARANTLMVTNPPAAEDAPMAAELAAIGVGPGLTFDSAAFGPQGETLWREMLAQSVPLTLNASYHFMVQNGTWQYFGKPIAEFGTEYAYRALVALAGFGANPVSVAVYPKNEVDSQGQRLNGQNRYVLHFAAGGLPPVQEKGFWSITAYNSATDLLIDNALDRYCINDRSQVQYNQDGSLDIYLQAAQPEEDKVANWLPIPEGEFHLFLRIYLPQETVVTNVWKAPAVQRI